jgi:protein SPA2
MQQAEEQTTTMRSLQKELDDLGESCTKEREREARRAKEDEEELWILRDRCVSLEDEPANRNEDVSIVFQLASEYRAKNVRFTRPTLTLSPNSAMIWRI